MIKKNLKGEGLIISSISVLIGWEFQTNYMPMKPVLNEIMY